MKSDLEVPGGYRWFSREEIAAWPPGHKACRACGTVKPLIEFHAQRDCLFGKATTCKVCRLPKGKTDYQAWKANNSIEARLVKRARARAKLKGWVCDLKPEDIVIPELCPVFGRPLVVDDPDWAPSLDRTDSSKGYTKDNVVVMSARANLLKNDARPEEVQMLADYLRGLSPPKIETHGD